MEPKSRASKGFRRRAAAAAVAAASGAAIVAALALPGASTAHSNPAATVHAAASQPLIMESSPESSITQTFNPYVQSAPVYGMGVDSLIYEPLMDFNLANPAKPPYYMLATSYKWGPGGKSITFAIRQGVKFNDGSPMTAADVAFSFNLLQKYADVNSAGIPITGATASGNTVTVTFSQPEYTNLQAIGNTYVVPQSIWSTIGDPGTYTDSNPVGTGPYKLGSFTSAGITLTANPSYWGGTPKISEVEFPVYASNTTVLSALTSNQLDWAGNFLTGLDSAFVKPAPATHHTWFAPVQTNSLEPNLNEWPTNQVAVRQAISLAINRTAISTQGEAGLEPVVSSATGLVLPSFQSVLAPSLAKDKLNATAEPAQAMKVLEAAGYKLKGGWFYLGKKEVTIDVTDPSSYTDYAEDDALVAQELRKAHINATFVGQTTGAWGADVASGKFQLTMHWSNTGISAYLLYNDWLNSALVTANRAGNFEGFKSKAIDSDLAKLAGQTTVTGELKYLTPIESYFAQNLPLIPTVYGAAFDEYNSANFSGWPSATNQYEIGQPGSPQNEIVVLHLTPTS